MSAKIALSYLWHDPLCEGSYDFGGNGYLSMNGSRGRIQCRRKFANAAGSRATAIELCFRVVLERAYEVRLLDAEGRAVVVCRLQPEGWIDLDCGDGRQHRARSYLTYAYGIPVVDPELRADLHTRESDEITFRFSDFNLGDSDHRGFRFQANDEEPETIGLSRESAGGEIASIEIRTPQVEAGTVFRLRSLRHLSGDTVLEEDTFSAAWEPVAPPADGYAYDHISEINLYPKDYRWLQTVTQYGWVKLRFPKMEAGKLGYTLMTPDIGRESALLLEESHPTIEQGCRAHTGICRGKFFYAGPEKRHSEIAGRDYLQDRLFYIEDRLPEANREYRFDVGWDPDGYSISVDGVPLSLNRIEKFPFEMPNKPYTAIDTITLHPGTFGTRLSALQKKRGRSLPDVFPEPHTAYWGDFEIEEA